MFRHLVSTWRALPSVWAMLLPLTPDRFLMLMGFVPAGSRTAPRRRRRTPGVCSVAGTMREPIGTRRFCYQYTGLIPPPPSINTNTTINHQNIHHTVHTQHNNTLQCGLVGFHSLGCCLVAYVAWPMVPWHLQWPLGVRVVNIDGKYPCVYKSVTLIAPQSLEGDGSR